MREDDVGLRWPDASWGQLLLGGAALIAFIIASWLSSTGASLTYENVPPDDGTFEVSCRTPGQTTAYNYVVSESSVQRHFDVTDGENALDAAQRDLVDTAIDGGNAFPPADGLDITRGINSDCARANDTRLRHALWAFVVTIALGGVLASVTVLRVVDRRRARDAGREDASVS